jgi:hypothetical protein
MGEEFHKVQGPVILGSISAIIAFLAQFFNVPLLSNTTSLLRSNMILISAFALGLGVINLMIVNYRYLVSRRAGLWMFAPIYLVGFPLLTILGILKNPIYNFIFDNVNVPVTVAINSFVSFFIIQGMYRSLKIKNLESALIIICTILVMIRKVPIGALIWEGFIPIGDWFLFTPGVAGIRALIITFGFGVVSMSIRTILGHERSHLGVIEEK